MSKISSTSCREAQGALALISTPYSVVFQGSRAPRDHATLLLRERLISRENSASGHRYSPGAAYATCCCQQLAVNPLFLTLIPTLQIFDFIQWKPTVFFFHFFFRFEFLLI